MSNHAHRSLEISKRAEQGQATRDQLLSAATRLFAEHGYDGTAIEAVLQEAGVSRGALYHHFANKEALFEAVLEAVEHDIAQAVLAAAGSAADPVDGLRAGAFAWLDFARDPVVQQIALIDAPSVVGWERWREIDEGHGFGLLKAALQGAAAEGRVRAESVDVLAHMLLAALVEVAMVIARAEDADAALAQGKAAVEELLQSLLEA
jgi:AcrR family transcriptional regulator